MTIAETFDLALTHHRDGRLADAEALYRQILEVQPNHAEALHLLGVIAHQVGRNDVAVEWIRRALILVPNNAVAHCNLGEAYRVMGRMDEAIASYRRAIEVKPDFPDAHYNLGNALKHRGLFEEAIAAYRSALQLKPDYPEACNNLGNALREGRQFAEAVVLYRRALKIRPGYPEALNNLGIALHKLGQIDESIAAYREAVKAKPDFMEAYNNLGASLGARGRFEEAIPAYWQALQFKPDLPESYNNLGIALRECGRFDEAAAACSRALELRPEYPEAFNTLGAVLARKGQFDEAIAAYRRALTLKSDYPDALNNLGIELTVKNQFDEAIDTFRYALKLEPANSAVHVNLGTALRECGDLDEAVGAYRHALELTPNNPEALNNLGNALKDRCELDDAVAAYRQALRLNPDYTPARSNLIVSLHYHPDHDEKTISEEQLHWNRQFSDPLKQSLRPHTNDRDPERRLRVGYVSPDFIDHSIARFALPLFERHERERIEILCYSGVASPDPVTERFRALAAGWRDTIGVSDARLAELVREDEIDILVDLSMHTARNRLRMFSWRPAPVQVTWLAYPGGAGHDGIGYRLTDPIIDPTGKNGNCFAEQPVRLPDCWCCYQPRGNFPEANELPALTEQRLTFGSLNNFAKVNERVLALWTRVLGAVKNSRLLLLCPEGLTRERVHAFFTERGIGAERVAFVGMLPHREYLGLYHRIDVGLDPFPFNGMTTTCDGLWMGVPTLTLPGTIPSSRATFSLLSAVKLEGFGARSEDDLICIALNLAGDLNGLAELRAGLRARIQLSPLMDAPRFAGNVEAAYRWMWRRWCADPH